MYKNFKNIFVIASSTIVSRISGFARDALFFSAFGISDIGAAFLFAFTIPNLFRRLLGEGALSSAVIPILSKQYVQYGSEAIHILLKKIIIRLSIILIIIVFIGCSCAFIVTKLTFLADKWTNSAHFLILLLPYMIFVCIAAIISAALNVLGYFLAASLNAIWLNACMIFSLIIGKLLNFSDIDLLDFLCFGVILGGMIQCLVPFIALKKNKSKFKQKLFYKNEFQEIMRLFWPGFFGAAVSQINLLISRSLAYIYYASAVSVLYLANRLIELPLGVFAITISTVFFPDMSKLAINVEDQHSLNRSFNNGILTLLWILLPSSIGLFCVKQELLNVFFEWGSFSVNDTQQILPIIGIYCISIPFHGLSTFLIRCFHAIKDMKTPVYIGCKVLILNAIMTLVLMKTFGIQGIASANAIAVIAQTYMLYSDLHNKQKIFTINIKLNDILRIIIGLTCIYIFVVFGQFVVHSPLQILIFFVPVAAISYIIIAGSVLKSCKK